LEASGLVSASLLFWWLCLCFLLKAKRVEPGSILSMNDEVKWNVEFAEQVQHPGRFPGSRRGKLWVRTWHFFHPLLRLNEAGQGGEGEKTDHSCE
jgi:hypothetical protein